MDDIIMNDLKSFPSGPSPQAQAKALKEAKQLEKEQKLRYDTTAKEVATQGKKVQQLKQANDKTKEQKQIALCKRRIILYYEKLGHKLNSKCPKKLPDDLEALQLIEEAVTLELNTAGGIENAKIAYLSGVNFIEKASQFLPWDIRLQGTTNVLQRTEDQWNDMLVQFSIENCEWFQQSATSRLLMFTAVTMMNVHSANKMMAAAAQAPPPSENLQREADDL